MELPPEFSNPKFNVKAWISSQINASGNKSTSANGNTNTSSSNTVINSELEVQVGQLFTKVQLQSQETAVALEDMIIQSLIRLPRTGLEVEKMGQETGKISVQLTTLVDEVTCPKASEETIQQLQELHRVKKKLQHCADTLELAQNVTAKVHFIDQKISAIGSSGWDSKNKTGSKNKKQKQPDEEEEQLVDDNDDGEGSGRPLDVESLATEISNVQNSLKELRQIDPSFGDDLLKKVETFESNLQQSLEQDCLDCIRRQDRLRAPKLLTTLRKIGRDQAIMETYTNELILERTKNFSQELNAAQQQQNLRGKSLSSGSNSMELILSKFYQKTVSFIQKEKEYLKILFHGDEQASMLLQQKVLEKLFQGIYPELLPKLKALPHSALVACFQVTHEQLRTKLPDFPNAVKDLALKPFEPLISPFIRTETENVLKFSQNATSPQQFHQLCEVIDQSCQLALKFFPNTTVEALVEVWNHAMDEFAANILQATAVQAAAAGTNALNDGKNSHQRTKSGGDLQQDPTANAQQQLSDIQSVLLLHDQCTALTPQLAVFEEQLFSKIAVAFSSSTSPEEVGNDQAAKIDASVTSASSSFLKRNEIFTSGKQSVSILAEKCQQYVKSALLAPIQKAIVGYKGMAIWSNLGNKGGGGGSSTTATGTTPASYSAGYTTPSESIRQIGEILMDLPMQLESLEVDVNAVSDWLTSVIIHVVKDFIFAISKLFLSTQLASDQLQTDLEYIDNVLSALVDNYEGKGVVENLQGTLAQRQFQFSEDGSVRISVDSILKAGSS